jgi:hypothetical protein
MGEIRFSVRLTSRTETLQEAYNLTNGLSAEYRRIGDRRSIRRQENNVLSINISPWFNDDNMDKAILLLQSEIDRLYRDYDQLIMMIEQSNRNTCDVDIYVSYVEDSEQGGLFIPLGLVDLAARLRADIIVSTTIILDGDET